MKKLIILSLVTAAAGLSGCGGASAPTASVPADMDWKETSLNKIFAMGEEFMQKGGSKRRFNFTYDLFIQLLGVCYSVAAELPDGELDDTIQLSLKIEEMFLRGKLPPLADIREVGMQCLIHQESVFIKNGASRQEIQQTWGLIIASAMESVITRLTIE